MPHYSEHFKNKNSVKEPINIKSPSKDKLLMQCIKQFQHLSEVYDTPVLESTRSLTREISRRLNICHHEGTYATKINANGDEVCCKCKNPILK